MMYGNLSSLGVFPCGLYYRYSVNYHKNDKLSNSQPIVFLDLARFHKILAKIVINP